MVISACLQEDTSLLYAYKSLGVNFNKVRDENGDTLLHLAISNDKYKTFFALLYLGVDLHASSLYDGTSPLNFAIMYGESYFAKKLIEQGVDINHVDDNGLTPLYTAILVEAEYPEFVNLVLNTPNIDVNMPVNELPPVFLSNNLNVVKQIVKHPSFDPTYNLILLHSENVPDLEKIIRESHLDIDDAMLYSYHQAKILGMKLDFDGCFKFHNLSEHEYNCFSFEGYANQKGAQDFLNSYNAFFNRVVNLSNIPVWSADTFIKIQTALNFSAFSSNPYAYLNKIESGDLVIIPSGWDGHSISFVIHKDKLYRCNRGHMSDGIHGIEEFIITNPQGWTAILIQQMLDAEGDSKLLQLDIIDTLGLNKIGEIENPEQTVGNCVWTSLEAALEASFTDLFLQYELDSSSAHYYGKQVFHFWEEYDHFNEIVNIIENKDLFVKTEIYDLLLLKALEHHHQFDNIFDIQKGSIILSEITDPVFHDAFKSEIGDKVTMYYPGANLSYVSDYQPPSFYDHVKSWSLYLNSSTQQEYLQAKEYYDFLVACDKFKAKNDFSNINLRDVIDDAAIQDLEYIFNPKDISVQISDNSSEAFEITHLELWKSISTFKDLSSEVIFA